MDTNELEGNRNVEKGKLKHKFALLVDDYQLLEESRNEVTLGRQQVNLSHTEEELAKLLSDL
jgi:hypothetical protein